MPLNPKQKKQLTAIIFNSAEFLVSLFEDQEQDEKPEPQEGQGQGGEGSEGGEGGEGEAEKTPANEDQPKPEELRPPSPPKDDEATQAKHDEAEKKLREEPKPEEKKPEPAPEEKPAKKPRKARGDKGAGERQAEQDAKAAADREPQPETSPTPAPKEEDRGTGDIEEPAGGVEQKAEAGKPASIQPAPEVRSNPDELLADARAAAVAYASKHGRQGLREALNEFTKGNITEVPQASLPALIKKLRGE